MDSAQQYSWDIFANVNYHFWLFSTHSSTNFSLVEKMIKKTRFLVKEAAGPGSLKPGIAVFIMVIWAIKFPRHMYIQNYFDIWSKINLLYIILLYTFVKKCQNLTLKVNSQCQKSSDFSFKCFTAGKHFLITLIFSKLETCSCSFVRYFRMLFWDDITIICWWKLSKQTSYWS